MRPVSIVVRPGVSVTSVCGDAVSDRKLLKGGRDRLGSWVQRVGLTPVGLA